MPLCPEIDTQTALASGESGSGYGNLYDTSTIYYKVQELSLGSRAGIYLQLA